MISVDRLHELLTYSREDGKLFWKNRQGARNDRAGKEAGCLRKDMYLGVQVDGKPLLAHRIVWAMWNGRWPIKFIDHVNRIRTDNRIENLREVNFSENCQNTKRYTNNKSGIKGVSRHTEGKWQATISVGRVQYYLGLYDSKEEAAKVRHSVQMKLHTTIGEL
jgi:hypothetical protein